MSRQRRKISIIGTGNVGASAAFALTLRNAAQDLVLVDIAKDKAEGEAMDLRHASDFHNPMKIISGDYPDTKDSDLIVITAGIPQKPGETRLELVGRNIDVFKQIIPEIAKYSPEAVILVVANPVDILTYITYKLSGFPKERVIGSGTVLDSSRLKEEIGRHFSIDPRCIQAYILGEHGDTEFVAWSLAKINGIPLDQFAEKVDIEWNEEIKAGIEERVMRAAYEVINRKGFTDFAISGAIERIASAIFGDEKTVLPVGTLIEDYHGIDDLYLSVPALVGKDGGIKTIYVDLTDDEIEKMKHSANALEEIIAAHRSSL